MANALMVTQDSNQTIKQLFNYRVFLKKDLGYVFILNLTVKNTLANSDRRTEVYLSQEYLAERGKNENLEKIPALSLVGV